MIDAKLLPTLVKATDDPVNVYGIWIPRKGDNMRLTVEVAVNYGAELDVEVLEKNYEDPGDGTSTTVSVSYSDSEVGRKTMEVLGCKELVRLKLVLNSGDSLPADTDIGWVLLRFLHPVWFESVKV